MAGQQGDHAQTNSEMAFFAMVIIVPLLCFALWHFVGRYIYGAERLLLYGALSFGGMVPSDWPVVGWFTRQYLFFRYTPWKDIELRADVIPDALVINLALLLFIGFYVMRKFFYIAEEHPFSKYGRNMSIYDFIASQRALYPHLRLMWKLRLLARPLDKGQFRMSESAKQFSDRNDLLSLPFLMGEPVVDERKAKIVFETHLGRLMPLPTDDPKQDAINLIAVLDNNEKAMLAAILPRLAACDAKLSEADFQKAMKKSEELVAQYWLGYDSYHPALPVMKDGEFDSSPLSPPPPPVDTTGCDEVLMKYLQHEYVRDFMLNFAYIRTFLYDTLQACRKVGKFPPTGFRWMRMLDRTLWLTVSSAGRREPFWECAGLHAHYLYERKAKKPVERPQVQAAVDALVDEFENRMTFSLQERKDLWAKLSKEAIEKAQAVTSEREAAATDKAKKGARKSA